MTDPRITAVEQYQAWSEEMILGGTPDPTVEQYQEYLRVRDMEDRMRQIRELATRATFDADEAERLALIAGLAA
ncbi:hypothetical protein [Microbacterium sp. zg-YB36]|uniref:hypothetical protein n=1 Tax=Microbacterium sp. zg-YB36 TaxID=2969407 RepID=UPI00214C21AE|nr:hypothetical protein [Microbacterium sp. zg-YB36]MDL5351133.1 hypothetical protein [Microbacterium sp. zg-YB36]